MQKKKFNLSGPFAIVLAVLVLLIFVPVNLIVSYYDKVYDMTPTGRYTLNDKTVQLLDSVDDKDIDVYYLSELRYLQDAPEYLSLYHTLTQLDARDNITLHCIDPDKDVDDIKTLDPTGILGASEADVFVKCGDVVKKVEHDRIFQKIDGVMHYDGEELISGAINTVTKGSLPTIYFLTGHGEKSIYTTPNDPDSGYAELTGYGKFAQMLFAKNYDVKELDLSKGNAIPDNAAIIYLAGPSKDLSADEFLLLDEYLENGGKMSFLLGPSDTEGRFLNIENLLKKYGILMDYNKVTETNPSNQFYNRENQQDPSFMRVDFIDNSQNEAFTEDLTSEMIMLIDNGAYNPGISNTRSFTEIPEDSFANAGSVEVSPMIANSPDRSNLTTETYTTKSEAMGGDADTAKDAEETLSNVELNYAYYSYNKLNGSKIIVFGSNDIVDTEEMCPTTSGTQNLVLWTNTWLYDADDSLGVGSKLNSYDYMKFPSREKAESTIALIVIFPLVVAIVGIAVWLKRRHA